MNVTTSTPAYKGGGRLSLTPENVFFRLKYWCFKRGRNMTQLKNAERQKIVWVLHNQYSISFRRIARELKITHPTASNDFAVAEYYIKRNKQYKQEVDDIDAYILYYANCVPIKIN